MVAAGGQRTYLPATLDAQAIVHVRTGLIDITKVGSGLHRVMRLGTITNTEVEGTFEEMPNQASDSAA